ncbi:MAG: HAD family hydrolase [Anaerolineae bacterium]
MTLKAIIFDFGGVLVRTVDHSLREKWERRLGLAPGEAIDTVFNSEMGRAAQLGQLDDAEHWQWVQEHLDLSDEALARFRQELFAGDRLDGDLLAYIDRLRQRYTVGLLSNATLVARQVFTEIYPLIDHFDSVTISAEEGLMKPDPRIYEIALVRAGVEPGQALFVDDFIENVEGARRVGMQAVHFVDPATVRRQLIEATGIN